MSDMRQVMLPAHLCSAVEKRYSDQFQSLEELLTFVLGSLERDDALHGDQAEQHLVEERLRELGYL
jgi:hypothetical protein